MASDESRPEPVEALDLEEVEAYSLSICKAMGHPLRAKILTLLTEKNEAMSPNQIHKILEADLGDTSYHCKMLVKYQCAKEVDTQPRRGATEHFYRVTRPPNISTPVWKLMPPPVRDAISRYAFELIEADVLAALKAGTMDSRDDRFMARMPVWIDEKGWRDIYEAMFPTYCRVLEVQEECKERLHAGQSKPIKVSVSLMCFEVP